MSSAKMPEKYGGILTLAFVTFSSIFGLIGFYQGVERGEADRAEVTAQIHHENTPQYISDTCAAAEGSAFTECIENAVKTSGEYQRAERDLAAQKNMANYAKWLLAITSIGTGITVVGVWFVKRTLEETSDAVAAANAANTIMRDEQRPWVKFEFIPSLQINSDGARLMLVTLKLSNVGKLPATGLHYGHHDCGPTSVLKSSEQICKLATANAENGKFEMGALFPGEIRPLEGAIIATAGPNDVLVGRYFAFAVTYDIGSNRVGRTAFSYSFLAHAVDGLKFKDVASIKDLRVQTFILYSEIE